ncbi:MAG: roadblock/LC7 domain-containing protein [Candidatus Pacebacteria bacterium]|nr:roadblock/LC7 domain-containing protein [Candidatus Paceibacterota bacterium]
MAFALGKNDVNKINRVLRELLDQSESTGCLVCDHSGYVLAQQGVDTQDPLLISALGAGVFTASRELARILGEDKFSAVFHQGEKKSIFICAVNQDVLLVVIFTNEASVGLVRLYAGPAADAIRGTLEEVRTRIDTMQEAPEYTFVLNDSKGGLFSKNTDATKGQ